MNTPKIAMTLARLGVRPAGSPEQVEALAVAWQRLLDLGPGGPDACGHDHECDEHLARNAAVHDAVGRVSWRQERRVFRSLVHHGSPEALPSVVWDIVAALAVLGLVLSGGPAGLIAGAAGALVYLRGRRRPVGSGVVAGEGLPGEVRFADVECHVDAAGPLSPLVGLAAGRVPVRAPMGGDSPHVLVSVGTGGGGSSIVRSLVAQLVRHGVAVTVIDHTGSQRWAEREQVTYLRSLIDIHDGLVELEAELARRSDVIHDVGVVDFEPHVVVVADAAPTLANLGRLWESVRDADTGRSPALEVLDAVLSGGRPVGIVAVVEDATGRALGPDALAQFGTVVAGRHSPGRLAILAPGVDPTPTAPRWPGRVQVVRHGHATETQALILCCPLLGEHRPPDDPTGDVGREMSDDQLEDLLQGVRSRYNRNATVDFEAGLDEVYRRAGRRRPTTGDGEVS